jgi:NAD(P)-dependent dehydrogenase (short-subunit alcohol dehydrogenase family)
MPDAFLTDISKAWDPDTLSGMLKTEVPHRRAESAVEITGAALYLAGDASSFTTGAVIQFDGGHGWAAS